MGEIVINTPTGSGARADGYEIRTAAIRWGIPYLTTMTGATAAARAISAQSHGGGELRSLQELHAIGRRRSEQLDSALPTGETRAITADG